VTPLGPATAIQKCGTHRVRPCESEWKVNGKRGFALQHLRQGNEVGARVFKADLATFFDPLVKCKATTYSEIEIPHV